MEFYFGSWWVGLQWQIWMYRMERISQQYLFIRLWFNRHQLSLDIHRDRGGTLLFSIHLPFFSLMNDAVQEAISIGTDPAYYIMPVITGKIFGKKINRAKVKRGKETCRVCLATAPNECDRCDYKV